MQADGRRPALAAPCRRPPASSVQSLAARVLSRSAARRPSPCESPAGGRPAAAFGAPPSPWRGARPESTRAAPQAALARGRLAADCAPAPKTPPQHVNVGGGRAPASGQTTISSLCLPWETQASPHDTSRRGLAHGLIGRWSCRPGAARRRRGRPTSPPHRSARERALSEPRRAVTTRFPSLAETSTPPVA